MIQNLFHFNNLKIKCFFASSTAPEAPVDIKVVVSSPQSLFVLWLPPSEPNGNIIKYNLYTRVVNGREELNHEKRSLGPQVLNYEAKGLQSHIEYQFWVTALTRVGEGKSSRVASAITNNRVLAKIISFGGPVIRTWRSSVTLSCMAVGSPRREWYKGDMLLRQGHSHNVQIIENGDLMLTNLQIIDNGNYSCRVDNTNGNDLITYHLIIQVPPSSPVLYVTSATSSSILMHWKVTSNGNAPLLGFTLFYRRSHGNLEEMSLSRHASSHELKGLMCGSTYQVYLTCNNKIGTSPSSTTLHVRTQGQAPGGPTPSSIISPNSTTAVLRLHNWPDNGCPIIYYVLQYRMLSDRFENEWILVSNALKPQRRFTLSGLLPSTLYQLRMEAHNVAGSSSADFNFITLTKEGGNVFSLLVQFNTIFVQTISLYFSDAPPPELIQRRQPAIGFFSNMNFLIVLVITSVTGITFLLTSLYLCYKNRKF